MDYVQKHWEKVVSPRLSLARGEERLNPIGMTYQTEAQPTRAGAWNNKERESTMNKKLVKEVIEEAKEDIGHALIDLTSAFKKVDTIVQMDDYNKTGYSKTQPEQMLKEIVGDFSHTIFAVAFLQNLVNRLSGQILLDERERNTDN